MKYKVSDLQRGSALFLGHGFDCHLLALKHLALSKDESMPDFFLHTIYQKIDHNYHFT